METDNKVKDIFEKDIETIINDINVVISTHNKLVDAYEDLQKKYNIMKENAETLVKRVDKAIKYINNRGVKRIYNGINYIGLDGLNTQILLDILKGEDKE